ncbi:uncharacterized protein LOC120933733 isoform X2 [Rana temporaria]|uniref:uncharacterized protein LOC120933733 isoform X2 n=1 Tax=Rana temporaria TaxID=8407 RepID=UPI001AAD6B53|nr:uncharacterized protein LOC120933733 isoform X2 [Rana temporaria]XP_040203036.1 uncharacterized protein LOC120933733 isoform X2 [Rana temporaria]XP_040203037.1 uncharacterized protein LOC120933733 isoform X2 [Rana temporaria]XP_040203038.1 uncharacterized protein LOC120933733 isoform X2 [Rana temporaria]XP_040203039.1 uncharacterized protein LOC120933733 isoform X2 [Rana temporaria]
MDNTPVPTESEIKNYRSLSHEERHAILVKQILDSYPDRENDPAFPRNPTVSYSDVGSWTAQMQMPPGDRVGKLHWCLCQCCIEMPTQKESMCCREILKVQGHIPEGGKCITESETFRSQIATEEPVRLMCKMLHLEERPLVDPDNNRRLRKTAYRTFIAWIYGFYGKKHAVIPSCAVKVVRELFPDPGGKYVNFIYSEDYDASEMAFH